MGHCWSHARREFYERYDDYPQDAGYAIELIDMLFDFEDRAKTFEELRTTRRQESRVVCEEFYKWYLSTLTRFLPGDGISKAIQYCLNHRDELTLFLRDLSVPMSNNDAERALRHAVVGRKNYNGSQTINGADVAATLFTVIETCKKVSVQPTEYLRYLISLHFRA